MRKLLKLFENAAQVNHLTFMASSGENHSNIVYYAMWNIWQHYICHLFVRSARALYSDAVLTYILSVVEPNVERRLRYSICFTSDRGTFPLLFSRKRIYLNQGLFLGNKK